MEKMNYSSVPKSAITTTLNGACEITGLGRNTVNKIAKESGALIKIGKRNLYKVDVLKNYLYSIEPEK